MRCLRFPQDHLYKRQILYPFSQSPGKHTQDSRWVTVYGQRLPVFVKDRGRIAAVPTLPQKAFPGPYPTQRAASSSIDRSESFSLHSVSDSRFLPSDVFFYFRTDSFCFYADILCHNMENTLSAHSSNICLFLHFHRICSISCTLSLLHQEFHFSPVAFCNTQTVYTLFHEDSFIRTDYSCRKSICA